MDSAAPTPPFDIVLIGGGASGVITALQLLRQARAPRRIALLEPAAHLGDGVAYATRRPEHLLNVPAGKMSLFPDLPNDFVDYLQSAGHAGDDEVGLPRRYVSRMHYATYLRDRLASARAASPATLDVQQARVAALQRQDARWTVQLEDGGTLQAAHVVLAVGNAPRPLPLRGASALEFPRRLEAWDTEAVAAVSPQASLCVVGSGLTMVDVAITRDVQGQQAPLHVVSRHGVMPLPRAETEPFDFDAQALHAMGLRQRLRHLRRQAAIAQAQGLPWQSVMETVRPMVRALWQSLHEADQRRFLRHAVRYWDVHRHGIDPALHQRLVAMRERGTLRLHRARLDAAWAAGACIHVEGREESGGVLHLEVQGVLNATGVEMRVQAMRNPLLQQLLGEGHAVPGPHGIGIDVDPQGRVVAADGQTDRQLWVIGSLRIGREWESLAIPELRVQADTLGRELSGA
ncbi:MAG TPA: FAD/NAD(P)-binding protein [Stenotrophomonas sp.]|jgi:uncharacterized NAD(P)/FAD-binding protein YdhS